MIHRNEIEDRVQLTHVRLPGRVAAALERASEAEGESKSTIIRRALARELGEQLRAPNGAAVENRSR